MYSREGYQYVALLEIAKPKFHTLVEQKELLFVTLKSFSKKMVYKNLITSSLDQMVSLTSSRMMKSIKLCGILRLKRDKRLFKAVRSHLFIQSVAS